jgi:glycerol kinase
VDNYILALDQGTTSSRAIVFDRQGKALALAAEPVMQIYPQPGWVEHDGEEIWHGQLRAARRALTRAGVSAGMIDAIGLTNQRETTLLWDKSTGKPVYNAIVWQCRRTASGCDKLKNSDWGERIRSKTGLIPDAYFSATKLQWLLDNVPEARVRAQSGELLFGTVDSWLLWKLSGGRVHVTDYSNASRTMLYNIHELCWDEELLELFDIPPAILPEVRDSSAVYGTTAPEWFGATIPLAGVAGDQQAALFGQRCVIPGMVKNTYGTGCFMLMNTGSTPVLSTHGLLTTLAWGLEGKVTYALEGSVFVAGAAIQWLRDELGIIKDAAESEQLATTLKSNEGVYMVPAFVGLGAPYWDSRVRGALTGLSRGSGRAHLARAALESIAYQTRDVIDAMAADSGRPLRTLRVDGGASANNFLMQFQADILQVPVERPQVTETTALGAAYLAGLATGYWASPDEISRQWSREAVFRPAMAATEASELYTGWRDAVERLLR